MSTALPAPAMGPLLGATTALVFFTGGRAGRLQVSIGPLGLILPHDVLGVLGRIFAGAFALLMDAITVITWVAAVRALVHRRRS